MSPADVAGVVDVKRPVVVVNPKSGGVGSTGWAKLAAPVTEGLGPFDVRFTEAAGDGRRIAAEEARAGRKLVVAAGGDGTISEVADGILSAGGSTELGIIPRGTGGDFRRTLDLPRDAGEAAARAARSPARRIDVGRVTFLAHDGSQAVRHFVNVASFGFSSAVAGRVNRSGKPLGAKLAYLGATLSCLATQQTPDVWLEVDGEERQRRTVLLIAIGNGRFFGGGMQICPKAALDDGRLDLTAIGRFSALGVVARLPRLFDGTVLSLKGVTSASVKTLRAEAVDGGSPIELELDGETPGRLPASFEVLPQALSVRY